MDRQPMTAKLPFKKACVTGGAGFIGSHLADKLVSSGINVVVFDNLSAGKLENIKACLNKPSFAFVQGSLLNLEEACAALVSCDAVFHLAANPEVRLGVEDPVEHFQQNIAATFNLLEAIRRTSEVHTIVFTSSSTVYGDVERLPTPEDYAPLKPVSIYGASKLASEALISSYAYTYGYNAILYRLANVVGARSQHGIILDFLNKLKRNPRTLEILGDGSQTKSYLAVEDCVDAILTGVTKSRNRVEIFNVGSEDQVSVKDIADIVCQEMGKKGVRYKYTGGVDGGRGWKGDVKIMLLSVEKLRNIGWKPKLDSRQAVRKAAKATLSLNKMKPR